MKTAIEILDSKTSFWCGPTIEVSGKEFVPKNIALEAMEEFAIQFGKSCCCDKNKSE